MKIIIFDHYRFLVKSSMSPVKQKILKAASITFSKYGFYKTAMEDIAANAQKAKGSLYYHFGSKEKLFEAVIVEELNCLKEQLNAVFTQNDKDNRLILKEYMLKRMEVLRNSPNYIATLSPQFYEHYDFVNAEKEEMLQWEILKIQQLISNGVGKGELDLPGDWLVYSQVLVMLLQGLEPNFFLKEEYDRLETHFDNLINIILKGISKS